MRARFPGRAVHGLAGLLALLGARAASAGPRDDPSARLAEHRCRVLALDCVLGASDRSRLRQAERVGLAADAQSDPVGDAAPDAQPDPVDDALAADLDAELRRLDAGADWRVLPWRLRPLGIVGLGDLVPDYNSGDTEPGMLSLRAGADARAYPGIFELAVRGRGQLDLFDGAPTAGLGLEEAWAGVAWQPLVVGFGLRDRHIGPGHRGSLMLTDNAAPVPLGTLALTSAAEQRFGRVHVEVGAGWVPGERRDVANPGLLLMDLRYLPVPFVELGATRLGLFGGEGRPTPSLGQLLLPTDPHVYDDPDRLEPDQDELAALDIRVLLPIGALSGRGSRADAVTGLDYVELYWQYGAEDVIAADLGGLSYPSLAGIANLYGVEAGAGPLVVSFEGARILDDYFRWYTGHRVYHDGLTRDGRPMAHAAGGDSLSWWGAVAWQPGAWGAELSLDHRVRVGVIEALGPNLLALETDERRTRVGLEGWLLSELGWWTAKVEVERVEGAEFVEGADGWAWRVAIGR